MRHRPSDNANPINSKEPAIRYIPPTMAAYINTSDTSVRSPSPSSKKIISMLRGFKVYEDAQSSHLFIVSYVHPAFYRDQYALTGVVVNTIFAPNGACHYPQA